ncbi:MAG: hypothetical protein JRD93_10780 [Deltaproteobacteria bacterium]|nr:hypothetical protein [Deltaproteobacteria bacterium]MBW2662450.1 hypothetical protein [Deltaproteobacteria bacterium]
MGRFVKKKLAGVQEKTEVRSQMSEVGKRLKMAQAFGEATEKVTGSHLKY